MREEAETFFPSNFGSVRRRGGEKKEVMRLVGLFVRVCESDIDQLLGNVSQNLDTLFHRQDSRYLR